MTPRGELLERMAASLQAWQRALGSAAAGGAVLEVGGLVGSVVPAAPARSILNAAVAEPGTVLDAAVLEELGFRYEAAGTTAWGVWAHEGDAEARAALAKAGLTIDSRPTAMAMDLAALEPLSVAEEISVERTGDIDLLARPLSAGYAFPAALITDGLPRLLDHGEGWVARIGAVAAAAAVLVPHRGDAGVFMVATAPNLRGRGAAGAAVHRALLHAREQGCTTTTLQASAMGRSVYARIGYTDLGTYHLWERRVAAAADG